MFRFIWPILIFYSVVFFLWKGATYALTPEEILKLKAAGVSEKTIQLLLQQDQEKKIPPGLVEQGYATDHPGTFHLKDGRTITSTGKRQLPLHYPTEYPPISPYAPQIYPYIAAPPVERWRGAPVSESPPALGATTTPPSTPAPASPNN